jgi:hypothetical protein
MIPPEHFPRLRTDNHRITSPSSSRYNCIAWAAEDSSQWWQPGLHWFHTLPANVLANLPDGDTLGSLAFGDVLIQDVHAGRDS